MKAVNAGEVDGGVIYHYYYFGDQAKTGENSKNVALHYFKNQDPGAFVSHLRRRRAEPRASTQDEPQAFLKFITGKEGQEVLREGHLLRVRRRLAACRPTRRWFRSRPAGARGRPVQAQLAQGHRPDDPGRPALVDSSVRSTTELTALRAARGRPPRPPPGCPGHHRGPSRSLPRCRCVRHRRSTVRDRLGHRRRA